MIIAGGGEIIFGFYFTRYICTQSWCSLVSYSIRCAFYIIGFFLFCVVAHWYKRVRDEDYSPQRVVVEVYDRYLTAAAAQSRTYSARN